MLHRIARTALRPPLQQCEADCMPDCKPGCGQGGGYDHGAADWKAMVAIERAWR